MSFYFILPCHLYILLILVLLLNSKYWFNTLIPLFLPFSIPKRQRFFIRTKTTVIQRREILSHKRKQTQLEVYIKEENRCCLPAQQTLYN